MPPNSLQLQSLLGQLPTKSFSALVSRSGQHASFAKLANYLIEQVVEVLSADLRNKEITVALDLLPDLPATEADAVQIQQVVHNLIQNASEALEVQSRDSKELMIRTKWSGLGVTVEIEDNGTGVPEPEWIFEAFFTTKEDGLGAGIRSAAQSPRHMEEP